MDSLLTIIKVKNYEDTIKMKCEIGLVLEVLLEVLMVGDGSLMHKQGKTILAQLEELKKCLESTARDKRDFYEICENKTFGFQEIIAKLFELLRPFRIIRDDSVSNLGHIFQKELNFKPSEFSRGYLTS